MATTPKRLITDRLYPIYLEPKEISLEELAKMKVMVDEILKGDTILELLDQVPVRDRWDRRAKESLLGSMHSVMVRIIQQVAIDAADNPRLFFEQRRQKLKSFETLRQSLFAEAPRNFHPFTVLMRSLENFLAG